MGKLCECGCGHPAPIAKMTNRKYGHVQGEPVRFILGHQSRRPLADKFWEKVAKSEGCWEWTAQVHPTGYGILYCRQPGRTAQRKAHRVAWELANGPIPEGMCICHRCDNRRCVRPDHLFLGTVTDNNNDRHAKGRTICGGAVVNAAKTHCKRGHELTPENTYFWLPKHGKTPGRHCRRCRAEVSARRRAPEAQSRAG